MRKALKACQLRSWEMRRQIGPHATTRHGPFGTGAQGFRTTSRRPFWKCHSHNCALTHSPSAVHARACSKQTAHVLRGVHRARQAGIWFVPTADGHLLLRLLLLLLLPASTGPLTPPNTQYCRPARESLAELGAGSLEASRVQVEVAQGRAVRRVCVGFVALTCLLPFVPSFCVVFGLPRSQAGDHIQDSGYPSEAAPALVRHRLELYASRCRRDGLARLVLLRTEILP